ncbi:P pilus assembly porin PapC [Gammaproteobacteria bacterium]
MKLSSKRQRCSISCGVTWCGALLLTLSGDPTQSLADQVIRTVDAIDMNPTLTGSSIEKKGVEGFYTLYLNGVLQNDFVFVFVDDVLHLYMAEKDFRALDFAVAVPAVERNGIQVVPLFGQNGVSAQVDSTRMALLLEVPPSWYSGTHINLAPSQLRKITAAVPGALFNYSLQFIREGNTALGTSSGQSLSVFGPMGLFQVSTAMTSFDPISSGSRFRRLGATFFHDNEKNLTTFTLGDSVVPSSVGVPAVRFGGVSYQRNFGLEPNFSTLETPTIFNEARLPSTLEFFLNDRRIGSPVAIGAGPFEIGGLPTVDTSGQIKVLIRDALNNERIVTIPYIRSPRLYREGLHSFSYTAGWLRPDLDRYQTPFMITTHRYGWTRWLTLDAGVTASAASKSLGISATFPLRNNMIGDVSMASSRSAAGSGQQFGSSSQWLGKRSSVGVSINHSSRIFRLLGDTDDDQDRPRNDFRLFAAHEFSSNFGGVSATFGRLSVWGGATRLISSLGWSKSFEQFSVSINGVRNNNSTAILLILNVPLGPRGFLSNSVQQQDGELALRTDYSNLPVADLGTGYRMGIAENYPKQGRQQQSAYANIDARSPYGEYGLDVDIRPDQTSWRMSTAGSVGILSNHPFLGPPINSGFALVSTGDVSGVSIYRWNLPVAVTDSRGLALVTDLSPYQDNLLALRPDEIPFEYRITNTEMIAVPHGRGGIFVEFPIYHERPAVLVLQLPDGRPIPAGAIVTVMKTHESALVGLRGETFVQNLPEQTEIEIPISRRYCRVVVNRPQNNDPQPRLGPYTCAFEEKK